MFQVSAATDKNAVAAAKHILLRNIGALVGEILERSVSDGNEHLRIRPHYFEWIRPELGKHLFHKCVYEIFTGGKAEYITDVYVRRFLENYAAILKGEGGRLSEEE